MPKTLLFLANGYVHYGYKNEKVVFTRDISEARLYNDIDAAKKELYEIKYFHRHLIKGNWKFIRLPQGALEIPNAPALEKLPK